MAYGVDPDALVAMGRAESNLDPSRANPASTAKGLFQFIDKTWDNYGNGADPFDPYASADAGAHYAADNAKLMRSAGISPDGGALYLGHFLGGRSALKVLRASDDAPVASLIEPGAIKANPFLAHMTVGDLKAWSNSKVYGRGGNAGGQTAVASAVVPGQAQASGVASPSSNAATGAADAMPDGLSQQLVGISRMIAGQNQPMAAPVALNVVDPSVAARARIVRRVLAGKSAVEGLS